MRPPLQSRGSLERGPVEAVTRRKKRSPSDLRREARRNAERLRAVAAERGGAWAEGGHPNATFQTTRELDELHGDKRQLRRDVYRRAPGLEGADVRRVPARRVAR